MERSLGGQMLAGTALAASAHSSHSDLAGGDPRPRNGQSEYRPRASDSPCLESQ